jgi:diguanylate cyclase (GGDEF)-like protein
MDGEAESANPFGTTQPSDWPEMAAVQRGIWAALIFGVAVALCGLVIILARQAHSALDYLLDVFIFAVIITVALAAARKSRQRVVALEWRLQLRLAAHNVELQNIATHDDLTQLFNRRYFFERLHAEVEAAKRFGQHLAVIMMDVDSLKSVNDSCGHGVGDQVLANFGRFLLSCSRSSDIPARIGGDEFAIILRETSKRGVSTMVSRFRRNLDGFSFKCDGTQIKVVASFGISGYPWGGDTVDAIMRHADASMYASKRARNKRCSASQDDSNRADAAAVPATLSESKEAVDTTPDATAAGLQ